jgi:hypothetical protein
MDRPILKVVADNQALTEALKEVLLEEFLNEDGRTDDALSDAQLGQMFRARLVGIQKVESVFKKIARYRSRDTEGTKINGAR